MIELGELEFKAEDFLQHQINLMGPETHMLLDVVNRILREKLAKAPEVEGWWSGRYWDQSDLFTHRARLVCIEEIEEGE